MLESDGSKAVRLTPRRFEAQYPAWSPDGSKIVFTAVHGGGFDLFVMNADGSRLRQLTDSPQAENWPMWSPDGSLIAYHREAERGELYVMNPDGSGRRPLLGSAAPSRDCGVPGSWAPATWIVLNCSLEPGKIGIGAIEPGGRGLVVLLGGREAGFADLKPEP